MISVGPTFRREIDSFVADLERHDLLVNLEAGAYAFTERSRTEIACSARSSAPLARLTELIRSLVDEAGYAHVCGLPEGHRPAWLLAIGEALGPVLDDLELQPAPVLISEVRPGAKLQGSQLRELDLHSDYSMLSEPPRLTVLRNVVPDPHSMYGTNGVVDVSRLVFRHDGSEDCQLWFSVQLPFAAMAQTGSEHLLWSPILTRTNDRSTVRVRFHLSRIRRGFALSGRHATPIEARAMSTFLAAAEQLREEVSLCPGDLLVIDNHACLHARRRCSCVVEFDHARGRDTQVVFVSNLHGATS